jgi:hypothetical protein
MTDLTGRKPIICLDFDGVCHSYVSGWKGAAVIPDPPVPGMWGFLREAAEVFELNIFSSRTHQEGGVNAMCQWFQDHLEPGFEPVIAELRFPLEKPPAFVSLDDRVLTFVGIWPRVKDLQAFKPWNAKEV